MKNLKTRVKAGALFSNHNRVIKTKRKIAKRKTGVRSGLNIPIIINR